MGRFIGFAILAIVALVTLAVLFAGDPRVSEAVAQTQQLATELTPVIEIPIEEHEEESPAEAPTEEPLYREFPDTTPILSAERRAAYRTKDRYYIYVKEPNSFRPFIRIQYSHLEAMRLQPKEDKKRNTVPRVTIEMTVHYQVTARHRSEVEAANAPLQPTSYREDLIGEFAWIEDRWVLDLSEFQHTWEGARVRDEYLPRRPSHLKLVRYQFKEFEAAALSKDLAPPESDDAEAATSQTNP